MLSGCKFPKILRWHYNYLHQQAKYCHKIIQILTFLQLSKTGFHRQNVILSFRFGRLACIYIITFRYISPLGVPSILLSNVLVKSPTKSPISNHHFSVSSYQTVLYNSVAIYISNLQSQLNHTAHFGDLKQKKIVIWYWWFGWWLHQKIGE